MITEENIKENAPGKQTGEIESMGTVIPRENVPDILTLSVIGQIEGHFLLPEGQKTTKYEHILPLLASAEQDKRIRGLLVIINTVGGDVEAGLAIAEMLAGMKKPSVSLILGGGHSIGLPIALACKRSFAVPSASMTIHPVRISGVVLGVPQSFFSLEKMQARVTDFVIAHSRIERYKFEELMMNTGELTTDVGSVISGEDAVKLGLVGKLGGISDAVSELKSMISGEKKR